MIIVQRSFTRHRRAIVITMTILIALAMVAQFGLGWVLAANSLYGIVGIVGLIPLVIKAINSLKYRVISIELLVSVAVLGALAIGEFSEAGIVTWLFLLGEFIEDSTLARTRSAIRELTELAPQTALRVDSPTDRNSEHIDVDDIDTGDYLLVKTGAQIPVDGHIVYGDGLVDESSITGEPLPRHAGVDSKNEVFAGTLLTDGTLVVQASKVGEDTVLGKILELVEQAEDSKTSAQRLIDSFSRYYTPVVLLLALIVGVVTLDVRIAITILVLGCPGALVIGVPVSNVAGIGLGARHGVLAKGARMLQAFSNVDTIVFDKTGTLTSGHPSVVHVQEVGPTTEAAFVWRLIGSVEHESSHPLSAAVTDFASRTHGIEAALLPTVSETHVIAGKGVIATVEGHRVAIGNAALMAAEHVTPHLRDASAHNGFGLPAWDWEGLSSVYASVDGSLRIAMGIGDTVRRAAAASLTRLRKQGIRHLIMLSGDGQASVNIVAAQLGLDEAHGDMLPQDKADFIRKLQRNGRRVAFVGDGINDSPALVTSDIGIAMGSGTATAVEISDVVLLNSNIAKLPIAYSIARATVANARENIAIALATVLFLFIGLFAGFIFMASGMLVHEASILVVVVNALRLLRSNVDHGQKYPSFPKVDADQV